MNKLENRIECVIVCFSYLDFLSITLERNLKLFDHVIVVTKTGDKVTQFCKSFNLKYNQLLTVVETDAMYFDNANWNKGLCLAIGLDYLKFNKYFCILDSDIILPPDFRKLFFDFATDKQLSYGSRRFLLPTRADYEDFIAGRTSEKDYLLLRGMIYGFMQIFHFESTSYQNFLKKNNNIKFIHWIKENHTIDWLFLREWGGATMVYDPEPTKPYPDFHYDQNNDYITGLAMQLPFNVAHLGDPGSQEQAKKTTFE